MKSIVQNDVIAFSRIDVVKMILRTLSDITDLRYSIVARVTEDSWTACAIYDNMNFGLSPGDELELGTTYCNTVRERNAPLLVRHASREPEFQNHPALKTYAVESYIGVPLFRQNGEYFGVLCSLDLEPTDISGKHLGIFELMARLIAYELEAEEQRSELEQALKLAKQANEARARFTSILGHDLRNPLNTIVIAATILQGENIKAEDHLRMTNTILRTSRRMKFLIEDLLDASQTAQGNEILIQKEPGDLRDIFQPIIEEFRLVHKERQIDFIAPENYQGEWDRGRLGQVLSNLLSNALSYGSPQFPIKVTLTNNNESVILQVNNQGEVISEEIRQNLFSPFWRGAKKAEENANSSGLGLGLYIVKQIVKAHGGTITIESNNENGTTFAVILPYEWNNKFVKST